MLHSRRYLRIALFLSLASLTSSARAQTPKCNGTCEPDPSSTTYQQTVASRALVQNQRSVGPSPIRHANSTTQAANPGSSSYSYAIPVVHLPGRNGLDLDLTLYYNSHVWNTAPSSNILTLNADRDFPDYGFRLDCGYIESFTSGSSTNYILTEPDGTKRSLALKSGTTTDWQSTDATSIDAFPLPTSNSTSIQLLRRDGTQWQYVLGNGGTTTVFVPTQITDTNGNYISISYLPNPSPYNAMTLGPDSKPPRTHNGASLGSMTATATAPRKRSRRVLALPTPSLSTRTLIALSVPATTLPET
jgi:hypothetical protein